MKTDIEKAFIHSLNSYTPIGNQVILKEMDVKFRTKSGLSLSNNKKKLYKVVKVSPEIKNNILKTTKTLLVTLSADTPCLIVSTSSQYYVQIDFNHIIGIEEVEEANIGICELE